MNAYSIASEGFLSISLILFYLTSLFLTQGWEIRLEEAFSMVEFPEMKLLQSSLGI